MVVQEDGGQEREAQAPGFERGKGLAVDSAAPPDAEKPILR